jgi:3-phenylpropionate/trans-cinnamate dioxygenase ferredoxin reductase subunit
MAERHVEHLLIGGGIASANCALELRERGSEGQVLLVGRELDPPYHRPPITKEYLRDEIQREQALIETPELFEERRIELLTRTSVTALDPNARRATLSTEDEVTYDTALIATGAIVRRLQVAGAELEGIHYLRALGNADSLRRELDRVEEVVLVGGSYIACEVAASLTALGKRCTQVMLESVAFERGFGRTAGGYFQGVLEQHGIELLGSEEVARFEPPEGGQAAEGEGPRVGAVSLQSGRLLSAQLVVAGVGAIPDVMLARRAGLEIGGRGGVRCDARLQTEHAGLYAAGDMCEYDSVLHGQAMRIEHEEVAAAQGRTVARNMLGTGEEHREVPYFFSDLADWTSLEYVGPALEWDEEIVRGSLEEHRFSIWYLNRGRLAAALSVGRSDDLELARRLMTAGADLGEDKRLLADPSADLEALAERT